MFVLARLIWSTCKATWSKSWRPWMRRLARKLILIRQKLGVLCCRRTAKDKDGQCLYTNVPITCCVTARELLQHFDKQTLYSRLPLLFSPSVTKSLDCVDIIEWLPGSESALAYGLDIVQSTSSTQGVPNLHAQLFSALALRACLQPKLGERRLAKEALAQFASERREQTVLHTEAKAWGLRRPAEPAFKGIRRKRVAPAQNKPEHVPFSTHGILQDRVKVTYTETVEDPTPLDMLHMTEEVQQPWRQDRSCQSGIARVPDLLVLCVLRVFG
eukprot:s5052_g8.t1